MCVTVDNTEVFKDIAIRSIQGNTEIYLENDYLFVLEKPIPMQQGKLIFGMWKSQITSLEKFSLVKAIVLSLILFAILVLLRFGLSAITVFAVSMFPDEWEETIGRNAYESLKSRVFDETEISPSKIATLRSMAKELASVNGFQSPEILFHKSDLIGANALAFPGGPIILTDELVSFLDKDELILAVLAHEFAHVEQRHSLHQIIEIIGITAIISVLFGSDQTLFEEASFVGMNLWASKKSRDFEREADLMAVEYTKNAGFPEDSFALALKKMTGSLCSSKLYESA